MLCKILGRSTQSQFHSILQMVKEKVMTGGQVNGQGPDDGDCSLKVD